MSTARARLVSPSPADEQQDAGGGEWQRDPDLGPGGRSSSASAWACGRGRAGGPSRTPADAVAEPPMLIVEPDDAGHGLAVSELWTTPMTSAMATTRTPTTLISTPSRRCRTSGSHGSRPCFGRHRSCRVTGYSSPPARSDRPRASRGMRSAVSDAFDWSRSDGQRARHGARWAKHRGVVRSQPCRRGIVARPVIGRAGLWGCSSCHDRRPRVRAAVGRAAASESLPTAMGVRT